MSNPNPEHNEDTGERAFVPAVDRADLVADPSSPSLDQYAVDWLPGQAGHVKRVIQALSLPSERPKDESLVEALAEQKRDGIKYEGFEADPDFANLDEQLKAVFGNELLDACLINKIAYYPDIVAVDIDRKFYAVPASQYATLRPSLPDANKNRFRAFSNFNMTQRTDQWHRWPIMVYSFEGESIEDKTYLPEELAENEKRQLYKIGTVVHEVAHGVYYYALSEEDRNQWDAIAGATPSLTKYVENYEGKPIRAIEQFAEAVRLVASNPGYLSEQSPEIADFIRAHLPHLQRVPLSAETATDIA